MDSSIPSKVAASSKTLAKQAGKQIAGEPFEVLKSGTKQVVGVESTQIPPDPQTTQDRSNLQGEELKALQQNDEARFRERYSALEKEIDEIRRKEQEKKALRTQAPSPQAQPQKLVEPTTRPSRGILKGMGKKLSDLKKRAEIRMPPSG